MTDGCMSVKFAQRRLAPAGGTVTWPGATEALQDRLDPAAALLNNDAKNQRQSFQDVKPDELAALST